MGWRQDYNDTDPTECLKWIFDETSPDMTVLLQSLSCPLVAVSGSDTAVFDLLELCEHCCLKWILVPRQPEAHLGGPRS